MEEMYTRLSTVKGKKKYSQDCEFREKEAKLPWFHVVDWSRRFPAFIHSSPKPSVAIMDPRKEFTLNDAIRMGSYLVLLLCVLIESESDSLHTTIPLCEHTLKKGHVRTG